MSITGTHMLFYTSEPEKLRAMLRDVFGFKHVDAGGGWLIFALPPAEIGVHPSEGPNWDSGMRHEISFMCDDIHKTMADLQISLTHGQSPTSQLVRLIQLSASTAPTPLRIRQRRFMQLVLTHSARQSPMR